MNEKQTNTITRPDYNNLTTVVSIPFLGKDCTIKAENIHSAERDYIAKRDESYDFQEKICYDRARAVCKWAESCGATLRSQRVQDGILHLSLSFSSVEELKQFEDELNIIDEATMNEETLRILEQTKEGNTITHPDYNNLTTVVSIPFPGRDRNVKAENIHSAERDYITKRDKAFFIQKKICYDRARAVCKWAESCGATLESQRVQDGNLYFSFSFPSVEELKDFEENTFSNIDRTTMTRGDFKRAKGRR